MKRPGRYGLARSIALVLVPSDLIVGDTGVVDPAEPVQMPKPTFRQQTLAQTALPQAEDVVLDARSTPGLNEFWAGGGVGNVPDSRRAEDHDSGSIVAFVSTAAQIVSGDTNNKEDAFVRNWFAEKGKDLTVAANRRTYLLAVAPNGDSGVHVKPFATVETCVEAANVEATDPFVRTVECAELEDGMLTLRFDREKARENQSAPEVAKTQG